MLTMTYQFYVRKRRLSGENGTCGAERKMGFMKDMHVQVALGRFLS